MAWEASDVHWQPVAAGLQVRLRCDGVLHDLGTFPAGGRTDPVARLKVLADLLTYRTDLPQEGRLRDVPPGVEMRLSTFPTLRGERAVVRLFMQRGGDWGLSDLGWPPEVVAGWSAALRQTSGGLIVSGPAGSGKTTSAYASLRQIVRDAEGTRNIVSIEDPIEREIEGVAQAQVHEPAGFTLLTALRSLLRQDPEVIFVGEMRDPPAAEIAFQAALTGQLALTTFHASSAAGTLHRLMDMGLPLYVLRSGVQAIVKQRLVRRLCDCKQPIESASALLGWQVERGWQAVGCEVCRGTGYRGRRVLAEWLPLDDSVECDGLFARQAAALLETRAVARGMVSRWERAREAVEAGWTSPQEARRVLGLGGEASRGT